MADNIGAFERDQIVFRTLRQMMIPVALNFAGGYQEDDDDSISKVIEIHAISAQMAIREYLGV